MKSAILVMGLLLSLRLEANTTFQINSSADVVTEWGQTDMGPLTIMSNYAGSFNEARCTVRLMLTKADTKEQMTYVISWDQQLHSRLGNTEAGRNQLFDYCERSKFKRFEALLEDIQKADKTFAFIYEKKSICKTAEYTNREKCEVVAKEMYCAKYPVMLVLDKQGDEILIKEHKKLSNIVTCP